MAIKEIEEWSKTDASNNFTPEEGGWPEGMKRSDVNNAARAIMGATRRWYDDPEWLNITVNGVVTKLADIVLTIDGNFINFFKKGTRIKMTGGTPDPVFGTVFVDASFVALKTLIAVKDFDGHTEVPDGLTLVEAHIVPAVHAQFKRDPIFLRSSEFTDVGLQRDIDELEAANGGILVLDTRVVYVIKATVKIGAGVSQGNIRIIGRGAILQAHADLDGDEIMTIAEDPASVIDVNCILEDVIFDGNSSAMTVASAGVSLLRVGASVSFVWVRDTLFKDSFGHCVDILNGCHKVWFDGVAFKDAGENAIEMVDSANDIDQIFIQGCTFDTVANTAAITQGSGIHFAGKVHINNCDFINLNHATSVEIGINARIKGSASPSDESGRESTISGCRFSGTGLNARGIFLEGRDVTISNCQFNLTGAGTEGIFAEGIADLTERHIIMGCTFTDPNRAVRLQGSAEDCIVQGNIFESCDFPYTDEGKRNRFMGNILTNGIDGVSINSPSQNAVVSSNSIDVMSDDAIVVASGVTGAQILHNITRNITGNHLQFTGSTGTGQISGHHGYTEEIFMASGFTNSTVTTEELVTGMLVSISANADGDRVWIVESVVIQGTWGATVATPGKVTFRLRHGTNSGTPTSDTEICRGLISATQLNGVEDLDPFLVFMPHSEFTPASGDDVYVTVQSTLSADLNFLGTSDTFDSYLRVGPK